MKLTPIVRITLGLFLAISITACGGGGGGESTPAGTNNAEWNASNWDQTNWQ